MQIVSVARALPEHAYDQARIRDLLAELWRDDPEASARLDAIHSHVQVKRRHFVLTPDEMRALRGFGDANDAWVRAAERLGERALRGALDRAGLAPSDVDALFFVSVTGVACPSIDARLVNRMGLPSRVKRVPIFGLGCVGGAAGIARAADYVRAFPGHVAALLSVELCSLTFQRDDPSVANLVATGLFGDGATAAVVVGAERVARMNGHARGPTVLATRSSFYPGTEDVMGWEVSERGFGVLLSVEVPEVVRKYLRRDVDAFLAENGLALSDVRSWVSHPGGPKVMSAMQEALELPRDALELSWRSLRETGNLSSSSVLLVLEDTMAERRPAPGSLGLLLAMGPGFCSELVLLRW